MSQWTSNSDSGILRKNKPDDNLDELLVFGYACKLFREDEKALYIDQGKHLIPWMGDNSIKIDRYDCRGALPDLKKFEASREGYDAMRWLGLSDSDRKLEELCDKERYYSLEINEEEEELYKEEEYKRKNTNAFAYTYDVPQNPDLKEDTVSPPPEEEEVYVPGPSLDVPVDIDIPKTVKEYTIIEKTALFVCKQGPQMEILIKAKQAENPQFSFLTQNDSLYKFYRHLLAVLKNGRYQPLQQKKTEEKVENPQDGDHYLHPSLSAGPIQKTDTNIPSIPYKPTADCSYSQLVTRIQGGTQQPASTPPQPQLTLEQQQYYQYAYIQQYYEYYRHMIFTQQGESGLYAQLHADFNQLDANMQNYVHQLAYAAYLQQLQQTQAPKKEENAYSKIVSNVSKETSSNPYMQNVPVLPESIEKREVTVAKKEDLPKLTSNVNGAVKSDSKVEAKSTLLSLAAYGSDTDESESENEENKIEEEKEIYKIPTGEIKLVIDKLALYVSKNGLQFEHDVKARGDSRFEFLNDSHEFNKYYREKIKEMESSIVENKVVEVKSEVKNEDKKEKEENVEEKVVVKQKKVIAPVSFSIKKPKDDTPKEIKSALPLEESSDEEQTTETTENTQQKEKTEEIVENTEKPEQKFENSPKNSNLVDSDDPLIEIIQMTNAETKEAKRAEDKIKDKLAVAAKEKLAQADKDKALKLERKRKAAAFLKLKLQAESSSLKVPEKSEVINSPKSRRQSEDEIPKEIEEIDLTSSPEKERSRSRERKVRKHRKKSKDKDDSDSEYHSKKKHKEKKRKAHKRKHSKSRHEHKIKKKSKKHRRSESVSSESSNSS